MPDNIIETLQHLLQDVIAPDVRELKVRVSSLEKQMDIRFEAVDRRFTSIDQRFIALEQKMDVQFQAIMAAIGESRAQSELTSMRLISALSERVAVLESRIH